ncbi:Integrin alpha beta-propellor repeat protein [Actinobacteria bacterium OK074]|nr:Integrin alpha beta-propellor repeat protein [Actinobacteria bacterium OK074]
MTGFFTAAFLATAAAVTAPVALATPAAAATAKYPDDFNGDGYRDLAIGNPNAKVGTVKGAGAVLVVWGTAKGLDFGKKTIVTQNSPYVAGTAETHDFFGTKITTADLNKDGYADIVATAPGEVDGKYHGTITVLWGSKSGFSNGSSYHHPSCTTCHFATTGIAAGDFDADGHPDIVATDANHVWYLRGPFTKAGKRGTATVLDHRASGTYIDPTGVVSGRVTKDGTYDFAVVGYDNTWHTRVWFYRGGAKGPGAPVKKVRLPLDVYDVSTTIADFNQDGYGDLAIGAYDNGKGGAVYVLPGTSTGPSTKIKTFTQATADVPGTPDRTDQWGEDISAADANGDGYPDLAIGNPTETPGTATYPSAGEVTILRGGPAVLSGKYSHQYDYTTPGIVAPPDADEVDTWFGAHVLLRDYNRDGRAELLSAATEAGDVYLLPGTSGGPTGTGSLRLTAAELGMGSYTSFSPQFTD